MEPAHGMTGEIYRAVVALVDDRVREIRVTREDFDALRDVVAQLAEAQARTDASVKRLAEAQARTDASVKELAEAQARTDASVKELAEAQARTDASVKELAEAQTRTEQGLARLERAVEHLAQQVGALSENVGFGLEDIARVTLPGYLGRQHQIKVDRLRPRFFQVDGQVVEIDLYGEGSRNGEPVVLLGEVKARIYRREVGLFLKRLSELRPKVTGEVVPLMFGYYIDPSAEEAAEGEVLLIGSYQPATDWR